MAFTPDGIAPPGIPLLGCSPTTTMRYRTVFGGVLEVQNGQCWLLINHCSRVDSGHRHRQVKNIGKKGGNNWWKHRHLSKHRHLGHMPGLPPPSLRLWLRVQMVEISNCHTWTDSNPMAMMNVPIQLTTEATAIAFGRGPWRNSSAPIIIGIGPSYNKSINNN